MTHPWDNLTNEQWEKICKRCGKCCLFTIQDEETEEIYHTNVLCRYYDQKNSACQIYETRCEIVPECLKLTKDNVDKLSFMPKSCAYRQLFDPAYKNKNWPSLSGRIICETDADMSNLEEYIVDWDDL